MDTEPGGVMVDCLRNSLILRKILKNFCTTELLELSLVNKQWNYEARSLLKDRGSLSVTICSDPTLEELKTFAAGLRRMKEIDKVVPFSGMSIYICDVESDRRSLYAASAREIDPVCEEILHQVTWKHLALIVLRGWQKNRKSSEFLVLEKKLKKFSSVLEEFSLLIPAGPNGRRIQRFLQQFSFPRLKVLKFQDESRRPITDQHYTDLIKALVSRAPNLQVLHTSSEANLTENLLEGSSAMHLTEYLYSSSEDEIPEFAAGQLQMKRMHLVAFSQDFNLERFNRITSKVLQTSRKTLMSMEMDASFLVPLMSYGIALENLTTLEMILNTRELKFIQPRIWKLVKSFDFARIFPKLNTVTIEHTTGHLDSCIDEFNEMIQQGNALLEGPTPDRSKNIRNLCLRSCAFSGIPFRFIAEMFPNIQKLSIEIDGTRGFGRIWRSKLDLQELHITVNHFANSDSLDSAFCGIYPEEVAELRKMDEEYLKAVNIVPVMPSIRCLKGLKTCYLDCRDEVFFKMHTVDPTNMFTKVAGLIAFQRCPGLQVTLRTVDERQEQALSHMKPYAFVVLDNSK